MAEEDGGALVPRIAVPGTLTVVAWELPGNLTYEAWAECGERLGRVGGAWQWWVGDWIAFGEARFGERYAQALTAVEVAIGQKDVQTLMNAAWVARKFAARRRRPSLSFSHHLAVAALDDADQETWLDRAERESLTSQDIRAELRAQKKPAEEDAPECRSQCAVHCPPKE